MSIRNDTSDRADPADNANSFGSAVYPGSCTLYAFDNHVGGRAIQHTRQKGLAADQPVDTNAPVQQAHDGLDSMWAAADHNGFIYLAQPAAQVEIVMQAMEGEYAIEIA